MEIIAKESDRWLRQAEYDLRVSEWNLEGGFFAPACFWAQQAAAKGLRAFLFFKKEDARETRSVIELLGRAITYDEAFKGYVESSGRLDIYYKTSRFPDAIPGGIPAEVITEKDARESVRTAADIIRMVEETRKNYMPETI
ncbi:MAG: HEPN domain-containing protein [Deltaproteobacteria bacterium]|nr:HEPN domain-containing protein [Deltaproteobacteria bacterium]